MVSGNGAVHIEGHGAAVIRVSGQERLDASGIGRRIQNPDGSVTFYGWKGQINAAGTRFTVNMNGGLIEFKAAGSGQATLQGRGVYRVCHRDPAMPCTFSSWIADGAVVTFGE